MPLLTTSILQVLSLYHSSIPLTDPGQLLRYDDVPILFDMTGLTCAQMKHICTELSKNPQSSIDFELTGVPDETVLKACFKVPKDSCIGKLNLFALTKGVFAIGAPIVTRPSLKK